MIFALPAGGAATATCDLTASNGFSGTVTPTCPQPPAGATCTFTPAAVTLTAGGTGTTQLTLQTGAGTPLGRHEFRVRAVSGFHEQEVPMTLDLLSPTLMEAWALVVDASPLAGGSSNLNGILEPGEEVLMVPSWANTGASGVSWTGALTGVSGTGSSYVTLLDNSADYGTVASGTAADCLTATGDCYGLGISLPPTRPAAHWDFQTTETLPDTGVMNWNLHVGGSFTDVPSTHAFYRFIETLLHSGITGGCTTTEYCPGGKVTRAQMAIFLARAMAGSDAAIPSTGYRYDCSGGGQSVFNDIPPTAAYCRHVHYILTQGVTGGCTPTQYCPNGFITRGQMAIFLARILAGSDAAVPSAYSDPNTGRSYDCNPGSPQIQFTDAGPSTVFCRHAHYIWARGIVDGCAADQYCPGGRVLRSAMAKFLTNAFAPLLYHP